MEIKISSVRFIISKAFYCFLKIKYNLSKWRTFQCKSFYFWSKRISRIQDNHIIYVCNWRGFSPTTFQKKATLSFKIIAICAFCRRLFFSNNCFNADFGLSFTNITPRIRLLKRVPTLVLTRMDNNITYMWRHRMDKIIIFFCFCFSLADQKKEEGNELYKTSNYREALQRYSEAISKYKSSTLSLRGCL